MLLVGTRGPFWPQRTTKPDKRKPAKGPLSKTSVCLRCVHSMAHCVIASNANHDIFGGDTYRARHLHTGISLGRLLTAKSACLRPSNRREPRGSLKLRAVAAVAAVPAGHWREMAGASGFGLWEPQASGCRHKLCHSSTCHSFLSQLSVTSVCEICPSLQALSQLSVTTSVCLYITSVCHSRRAGPARRSDVT